MTEQDKLTLNAILWRVVIPLIIGIVIVLFPAVLRPALDTWFPAGDPMTGAGASPYAFLTVIFTHGISLMIVLGVPLFMGLVWSKWAGGAAGFIMGTLYYIAFAGYNIMYSIQSFGLEYAPNMYADPSFIGNYIVGGILVGYIGGALNNKSMRFKRLLLSGLTATIAVGVFQFVLSSTVAFAAGMSDPGFLLFTTMLPMIILGIIVPLIARISAGSELWHM